MCKCKAGKDPSDIADKASVKLREENADRCSPEALGFRKAA